MLDVATMFFAIRGNDPPRHVRRLLLVRRIGSWNERVSTRRSRGERAIRMVVEVTPDYPSQWDAMTAVASKLGVDTAGTLRKWVRRAEVDHGRRPGVTSAELAEVKGLRREVAELRWANEILKAASTFFAAEVDRPHQRS